MSRAAGRSPASLGAGARRAVPPAKWSPGSIVNAVKHWGSHEREMLPLIASDRASSFDDRHKQRRESPASFRKRMEVTQPRPKRPDGRFGLYAQYFTVGVVYGGLPQTMYGFFLGYLNVDAYAYAAATTVVALPWSFKFVFGAVNDVYPINGERRRPYIALGWAFCAVALWFLAMMPLPQPYWCLDDDTGRYITTAHHRVNGVKVAAIPCNPQAPQAGGPFALAMMVASFGYCVSDVAADGLTVQLAKKEEESRRGQTQTSVYLVRTIGNIAAVVFVGLGMNSREYNGSFGWGLSFSAVMAAFAFLATIMVPISWYFVKEPSISLQPLATQDETPQLRGRISQRVTVAQYKKSVWHLLRSKAMFYCVCYQFFTPLIGAIYTTASPEVKQHWAHVKALQNSLFSLVGLVVFSCGLWLVKKRLLHMSWRYLTLITTIFLNVIDMPFSFCTVYDVVRDPYFYLGETVLQGIPDAVNFVVSTFVIVEMAEGGDEGIVYGLLTTTYNVGGPFASAISNQLFGLFEPKLSDPKNYVEDRPQFRNTVALSFAVTYAAAFLSLLTLPLLPRQKAEVQARKRDWPRRDVYAWASLSILGVGLVYSCTLNVLAIVPATMCLTLVGGDGC